MAFDKFTAFGRMAQNRLSWLTVLLFMIQLSTYGQPAPTRQYLVLLRDKANSPYSIDRPEQFLSQRAILRRQRQNIRLQERDLPVNPAYAEQIRQAGGRVRYASRWLNGVLIDATETAVANIQQLPFVTGLEYGRALANARIRVSPHHTKQLTTQTAAKFGDTQPLNYGNSQAQVAQIGADVMHQRGFRGEGMLIAVLDAGFRNADRVSYLQPLFQENRVVATYDFPDQESSVYEDDAHGIEVLSTIAATAENQLYGTAYKAQFVLLRTEVAASENPVEEAYWLLGAEYADSTGADVINSSLGYTIFDQLPEASHTYEDLTGNRTLISRAANWAAEAGMVVVVSAGNEGNNSWRYIAAPADANRVLAIGSVNRTGIKAGSSSFGPSADGRVKPDLAALGSGTVLGDPNGRIVTGSGTSFAAPLVAGLAAGFWQAHPRLTAAQVTESLRRSGNQYGRPDDQLGYGIPNFERASVVADSSFSFLLYPNPFTDADLLTVQWIEPDANTPINATLTDATGRVLWRTQYTIGTQPAIVLPNLGLSAGMYYMTLIAGDQKRTVKVVKR